MAILPTVPGLEIDICIDGKRVREYTDPTHRSPWTNQSFKYIESKSGKEFAIVVRVQSPFEIETHAIAAKVEVDGVNVLGPLFRKERYESMEGLLSHTIYGVPERDGVRTFQFVELPKCEGDPAINREQATVKNNCKIGSIVVRVFECDLFKQWNTVDEQKLPVPDFSTDLGPEKTHAISQGRLKKAAPMAAWKIRQKDSRPIGTFIFEYRSFDALQDLDVVTFRPSPKKKASYRAISPPPEPPAKAKKITDEDVFGSVARDDTEDFEPREDMDGHPHTPDKSAFNLRKNSSKIATPSKKRTRRYSSDSSSSDNIFHEVPNDEDRPSPNKKQFSPSKKVAQELSKLSLRKSDTDSAEVEPEVVDLIAEV
ncbi:hypothetical protein GLAREA_08487 [Glarea lozoyensis ATCC 20868]|uniref:DUF7918 domain-containing protein n=1 Tax=Glarea lozoyensis (strain ATCC 20868 / MF5171) TaxID=1116229 RepID=S3CH60_GLAL2|nr:uncharacterized protein GLAREA_08487 [Glarea lozoyensis ATCC 20868]EPE24634.1 hypothetical protein GLAREA_08487 [Glarea lozoyensis ATCC 20868]